MPKYYSLLLFFVGSFSFSQTFNADLGRTLDDLIFLSGEYVSPAADASMYQATSSWYSTAKSLDKFQVEVSVHANALYIPNNKKSYTISNSDFSSFEIRGGDDSVVIPTALGGGNSTFFDFTLDGEDYEMQAFEGVDQEVLAHPFLQASVGLWKETDLTVRYSPKVKIDVSDYQIFGLALKHNLTQYNRKENSVEVAVLLSYSKFDLDLFFNEFRLESSNPQPGEEPIATVDSVIVDASSWLFQFIASKEFGKFELHSSLGLSRNQFNYELGGKDSLILSLFNLSLEELEETTTNFKGDVGLNYHIGNKYYISSMFTIGEFPNVNLAFHYKIN
ncbi:DUF6588 family protein [Pseudofulvibacter geojedonensis]|uniref:DUF6588 family protein n=1 Tax=Pseudofulvibacter geojedonensis TaxID=1123758 RepID=A0ABW3I5X9_9FLAO